MFNIFSKSGERQVPDTFIRELLAAAPKLRRSPVILLLPILMSFVAVLFDGTALALLGPLLQRVMRKAASQPQVDTEGGLSETVLEYIGLGQDASIHSIVLAVLLLSILAIPLKKASELLVKLLNADVAGELHTVLMKRVLGFGKLYFQTTDLAAIQELRSLAQGFATNLIRLTHRLFESTAYLVFYLVIMCSISWALTLFFAVAGLLMTLGTSYFRKKVGRLTAERVEYSKKVRNTDRSCFQSIDIVKGYGIEAKMLEKVAGRVKDQVRHDKRLFGLSTTVSIVHDIAGLCIVFAAVCAYVYFDDSLAPGTAANAAVFLIVARRLFDPIAAFHKCLIDTATLETGFRALKQIFSETGKHVPPSGDTTIPDDNISLSVSNLSFTYPDGNKALQDISFEIAPGSTTAIVGKSGAGKSTLIKLLLKSFSTSADCIIVEGAGTLNEVNQRQWCKRIGYIPQSTSLFTGTLRENLVVALNEIPDDEVLIATLKNVDLSKLLGRLEHGLDTLIGDGGNSLSRGEKQRVSVARMMLQDPDLVLIDEATSSLDPYTERVLVKALNDFCLGRTTVVVAHRLGTVQSADQIIVLDEGRIVEKGTFHSLIDERGLFHKFWKINSETELLSTGELPQNC